ncbi:MAG: penicillin-binding protein 1A [Neisseria sp.]|nr:penicillin-binding protein 1A [Neisseria sp.]
MIKKTLVTLFGLFLGLTLFAIGLLAVAVLMAYPKLPALDAVTRYNPKMPLMIYSSDDKLIGVYGEERRSFTKIDDFPLILKHAVIAAEDKRFYDHWGVDTTGVIRAAVGNVISGKIESGASTITQQVARNFFLTREQTFTRKFNEALMAYKIERSLTKDQILELYFNQIYLGQRAYGFAAAAQAYFNKPVQDLSIAEAAMLAGLPKAPSAFNPIVNPDRAKQRQLYILGNMLELNMVTREQHDAAAKEELFYQNGRSDVNEDALYVAEMARQIMYERYGEEAYTRGFRVYTTVSSQNQRAATAALRRTLNDFNRGRAFTGAEAYTDIGRFPAERFADRVAQYLSNFHAVENMMPALVTQADAQSLTLYVQGEAEPIQLQGKAMQFVRKAVNNAKMGERQVRPGAVLRVIKDKKGQWLLTQQPELQGALVSLDTQSGAILALVGGYDFYQKEFNRAIQALRQPGSTFKPFVYSAALQKGMTAGTSVNDAPLSLPGLGPNGTVWNPKNSDGKYAGFMTVHQALVASRNMISIRILMAIGVDYAHQYVQRFGFSASSQPRSLSMALGSGSTTPLEMARAYAVFANGGYRVAPYLIDRIYDDHGNLLARTEPLLAGKTAPQAIDPRNAYIMTHIMKDVTRFGTAASASSLKRSDIAGKTGTTNEQKDAWFVGYTPKLVTSVYIGYDTPRSMGRAGYGGRIALPVWIDYMRHALQGVPVSQQALPGKTVKIGGDYYYAEWQQTNPALPLDNRAEETPADELELLLDEEGVPLQPNNLPSTTQQPPSPPPSSSFDNLF